VKIKLPYLVIAAGVATIAVVLVLSHTYVPPNTRAAPYYYNNGDAVPPDVKTVMSASGTTAFTLAFVLADGQACEPKWDGQRPLSDDEHPLDKEANKDLYLMNDIWGSGGQAVISFGGAQGFKLELVCSTAVDLAKAYQKVIDKYGLKKGTIDIDVENDDRFKEAVNQARILGALKLIKADNPQVKEVLTTSALWSSDASDNYDDYALSLIKKAKEIGADVDVFEIMPFDFTRGPNMKANTIAAAEDLRMVLMSVFGWTKTEAYHHIGISGMNGKSDIWSEGCELNPADNNCEITTATDWTDILTWASSNHIARLSFWNVNRDRPCGSDHNDKKSNCSGITQTDWQFTTITAKFKG